MSVLINSTTQREQLFVLIKQAVNVFFTRPLIPRADDRLRTQFRCSYKSSNTLIPLTC